MYFWQTTEGQRAMVTLVVGLTIALLGWGFHLYLRRKDRKEKAHDALTKLRNDLEPLITSDDEHESISAIQNFEIWSPRLITIKSAFSENRKYFLRTQRNDIQSEIDVAARLGGMSANALSLLKGTPEQQREGTRMLHEISNQISRAAVVLDSRAEQEMARYLDDA